MNPALALLAGLLVGSFLNVVIHRLPRRESIVGGRSHCPGCGRQIRAAENVPVLSWLFLRGRCRGCGERISVRYPLVEAATALLYAAVAIAFDSGREVALGLGLVTLALPAALIDLEHRIIPNRLLLAATPAALAIVAITGAGELPEHLIAAAAAGGFLLAAAIAYPAGMGMGDVKLAAVLGLFLGRDVAVAMLAALVAGSVVGIAIIVRKGQAEGRKTAVPFGPFLALGALLALFWGADVIDWYLDTFTA